MFELSVLLSRTDEAGLMPPPLACPRSPITADPSRLVALPPRVSVMCSTGDPVGDGFHGSKSDLFIFSKLFRFLPSIILSTDELLNGWLLFVTSTLSRRAVLGVNAPNSQSLTLDKTLLKDGLGERDFALGLLGPSPPVRFDDTSSVPPFNLELGLFFRFDVFTFPPLIVGNPTPAKLLVVSPPP